MATDNANQSNLDHTVEESEYFYDDSWDSGYDSFDEDGPAIFLNMIEVQKTGCKPIYWFEGNAIPNFLELGWSDARRLCRELNVNWRTGELQLNFPPGSPFSYLRSAFARYHRATLRDIAAILP